MKRRVPILLWFGLIALCSIFGGQRAEALCLLCSCSTSASGVSFGTYDPLAASNLDSTGTITVSCSVGGIASVVVAYEIRLSTGGSGTFASRRMTKGASTLPYNLYTSSTRTTVWGDGTNSTSPVNDSYLLAIGPATNKNYTVYSRIPMQQNVAAGTYTDTIVVSVIY